MKPGITLQAITSLPSVRTTKKLKATATRSVPFIILDDFCSVSRKFILSTRFHFSFLLHNEETLLSLSLSVLLALCWRIGGYSRNDGLERWKLVNEQQQGTYIGT